ncbi:hypothetical protein GCM10010329_61700 [Streptomyces spiroverticillatus]|uniref:Uncharacterized protein n=2 Tax=Streptomyces finlayi TaxID=67296 RepID=A0A918X6A4_9ACTN|nr:hypothetical protein GCM10010329_61700 [Streptomyces spiroverticillatus]GHD15050.1 hypothetical protein GCM10010334_74730 [Streptomyces finlayi]
MVDARIKQIHESGTADEGAAESRELTRLFAASAGADGLQDLLDGTCTLIYMFMQWLHRTHAQGDKDVIEYVVPHLVATLRMMPRSVPPQTIPTMAALVIAAGTGLSPNGWRSQYGDWTPEEMQALEVTAFLIAEHINRIADDHGYAVRLVADALDQAETDTD